MNLPSGSYFAWGNGGQFIFVIPVDDLVVVHLARMRRSVRGGSGVGRSDMSSLLALILAAAPPQ